MPLQIVYVHNHDCTYKDSEYYYYPKSSAGCSFIVPPVCEELNVQLEEVRRQKTHG